MAMAVAEEAAAMVARLAAAVSLAMEAMVDQESEASA